MTSLLVQALLVLRHVLSLSFLLLFLLCPLPTVHTWATSVPVGLARKAGALAGLRPSAFPSTHQVSQVAQKNSSELCPRELAALAAQARTVGVRLGDIAFAAQSCTNTPARLANNRRQTRRASASPSRLFGWAHSPGELRSPPHTLCLPEHQIRAPQDQLPVVLNVRHS